MSGPGAVLILHPDKLRLDLVVPFIPFRAAGAMQAVADIQVGEKLLAAHGAKAIHESGVGKLSGDGLDLWRIFCAVLLGAAQLLQPLGVLIQRYPRGSLSTSRSLL